MVKGLSQKLAVGRVVFVTESQSVIQLPRPLMNDEGHGSWLPTHSIDSTIPRTERYIIYNYYRVVSGSPSMHIPSNSI